MKDTPFTLPARAAHGCFTVLLLAGMAVVPPPAALAADATLPSVGVIQPARRNLSRELVISATVAPYEQAEIYAKASGYLKPVTLEIGTAVKAGEVLAELDVPEMRAELAQAGAEVTRAGAALDKRRALLTVQERAHRRAMQLRKDLAITEAQLEEARGQYEAAAAEITLAEAEVRLAEARRARLETLMQYAVIKAPFAGVISGRQVDTGDFVRSAEGGGTLLFTLVSTARVRVRLEVPESDAAWLEPGKTRVELTSRSAGIPPRSATLTRIAGALQASTRTMPAEIELENADGRLLPGTYLTARLKLREIPNALVIPSDTLQSEGGATFVWLHRDGVLARREVTIGFDDGAVAEVVAGLTEDAQVVRLSAGAVSVGSRVRAVVESW